MVVHCVRRAYNSTPLRRNAQLPGLLQRVRESDSPQEAPEAEGLQSLRDLPGGAEGCSLGEVRICAW